MKLFISYDPEMWLLYTQKEHNTCIYLQYTCIYLQYTCIYLQYTRAQLLEKLAPSAC